MMGRTLIKVGFAALGMGLATPALAADYDGQLPGEGFSGMWSCLYARVDGGGSFYTDTTTFVRSAIPVVPQGSDPINNPHLWTTGSSLSTFDTSGFFEGGVGCQVSDAMRIQVVGGLNLKSSFADGPTGTGFYLNGDFSSQYFFASIYWDVTNYAGFTLYIGGGIGFSSNQL